MRQFIIPFTFDVLATVQVRTVSSFNNQVKE